MEMVHKIRRKSDGKFWEEGQLWGNRGAIFNSSQDLLRYVSNKSDIFFDQDDIEIASYTLQPHTLRDLPDWVNYNESFHCSQYKKAIKAGRFLFAVLIANITNTNIDQRYALTNRNGWFSIHEITAKTHLSPSLIQNIVKSFIVQSPKSRQKAFWVSDDFSRIRLSPACNEKIEQKLNV